MHNCPRCQAPVRPFFVAGIDIMSRVGFALAVTLAFAAVEFFLSILFWEHFERKYVEELLNLGISAGARVVLLYTIVWPLRGCAKLS